MRRDAREERVRRHLIERLEAPGALAASLECDADAVQRVGRCLLRRLRQTRVPLARALDEVAHGLPPGDEGLLVNFWARSEARMGGVPVPFDADGLERLRSKD